MMAKFSSKYALKKFRAMSIVNKMLIEFSRTTNPYVLLFGNARE